MEDLLPIWLLDLIYGIHDYILNCMYRLDEIKAIIRTAVERLCLVLHSIWNMDSFSELLHLQHEYLEAKHEQCSANALVRLDEFENNMNYLLARGSRVCLREIKYVPDLYAYVCDLFAIFGLLCCFFKSAIRYIQAKRLTRMVATWIRVVSLLINEVRTFAEDENFH